MRSPPRLPQAVSTAVLEAPRLLLRPKLQKRARISVSRGKSNGLVPPPRQLERGYQGTYLRFWRLVLTLRALATAVPPTSPRSLPNNLQKRAGMSELVRK